MQLVNVAGVELLISPEERTDTGAKRKIRQLFECELKRLQHPVYDTDISAYTSFCGVKAG